jgi:hypothetical protein
MPVIKIRRGTTQQWAASTRILQVGELGIDTTLNKIKAGNGINTWSSLSFISADSTEISEIAQDALATAFSNGTHSNIVVTYSDNDNSISLSTGPDVVTTTSLSNTLTDSTSGYVPISDVGNFDGVAPLDSNALIPDEYIPDSIARDSEIPDLTGYATETYVNTAVSNLVDSAPETLNTLNELAAALGDDANYAATISTSLGNKLDTSSFTYASITIPVYSAITDLPSAADNHGRWAHVHDEGAMYFAHEGSWYKALSEITASATYVAKTEPAIDYYITNSGTGAYLVNGVSNGTIHFVKGKKYRIVVNATGHPFWIQTVSGAYSAGNIYSTGITNGGTENGSILVELPQDAPDNLYYVCQYHSSMAGSISTSNIDPSVQTALNLKADNISSYLTDSTTSRTLGSSDLNKIVEFTSNSAISVTIPDDPSDSLFPIGSVTECRQMGTGRIEFLITSPAVLVSPDNYVKTRTQYSSVMLEKRSSNSWILVGDLDA